MKNLLSIVLSICLTSPLYAQNMLDNPDFEGGHPKPTDYSEGFEEIDEWESRYGGCNQNCTYPHSPDWFYNTFEHYGINAYSGYGYTGLLAYELIQQELDGNDVWVPGQSYIVDFHVQLPGYAPNGQQFQQSHYDNAVIKVYAATNKIRYKAEDDDDICRADYIAFSRPIWQDIVELASFDLQGILFGVNEPWVNLQQEIIAPATNYDWLAIQVEQKSPNINTGFQFCMDPYVLLDEVVIAKGCINNCSYTDGFIGAPVLGTLINEDNVLNIHVNDNISKVRMEIIQHVSGQDIVIVDEVLECPNGIVQDMFWNGKLANQSQVALGLYAYRITLWNDCGSETFEGSILKEGHNTTPSFVAAPCATGNVLEPTPCCTSIPDLYIDNTIIGQFNEVDFIAVDGIYASTIADPVGIIQKARVFFQAGREVLLEPGFETQITKGGQFCALIDQCTNFTKSNGSSSHVAQQEIEASNHNSLLKVDVYPNPSSGLFTLQIDVDAVEQYLVEVYDMHGRRVLNEQRQNLISVIDIQEQRAGVYLLKVQLNNQVITKPLIIE